MTEQELQALVDGLTLAEQVTLLSGQDFWSVAPLPEHGIGSLRVTDGPNGARGGGSLFGGVQSAAFPVGIALGSTWDPALLSEIGEALADEVQTARRERLARLAQLLDETADAAAAAQEVRALMFIDRLLEEVDARLEQYEDGV